MYAPVCTRFLTYDVGLDPALGAVLPHHHGACPMQEWIAAAKLEPDELEELDMEF